MSNFNMKDIVNLSQNRGFVFQGSEIYGGLANSWDYGPYGSLLKENIKNLWIKEFVQKRSDMMLQDSAILMNPQVWVASGHVGGFSDPLIDDKNTKERFRADKLLEDLIEKSVDSGLYLHDKYGVTNLIPESWSLEKQTEVMRGEGVKNPNTGVAGDWTDAKKFNLMFRTSQGVTDDSSATIYLRPETAQGIFVNFANILRSSRRKIPFGVAQVGKAFRNEITPGNFIFRTREFEQMEIEYFCEPGTDLAEHARWKQDCMNFLTNKIGIRPESLKFRDHDADELSHYSNATTDIEFKFPFGWGELWGIADRTDFDLKAHMSESKQDLSYFDPVNNKKYIPYVIEPSVGLTRLFLATLIDAYTIEEKDEETRTYLKLDPKVAPIKVGVLPVVKKISDIAKPIYDQLTEDFVCEYDDVGSVGKRYARFDEIGTPFCVTIDSNNYDEGKVTVRYRDSMEQELVEISKLNEFLREKLR
ncbi:MAG: glycine--tRNA ligase [Candidatus Gracilibacteria bacterium]|nr:glycine--tRNA ligase [Candidatus Gracilibacteria bacterium]